MMVHVTACHLADRQAHYAAQKRGSGQVLSEADLRQGQDSAQDAYLDQMVGREPSPEVAAEMAERCEFLLRLLEDPILVRIALMKLACYTNEEIALTLGCSLRSVNLKLQLIRKLWERER